MITSPLQSGEERGVTKPAFWMLRCLAVGHFAWGLCLLMLAAWFAYCALRVLPYMSSGTIWTNLPTALSLAGAWAFPPAALSVWMVNLGRRIWIGRPQLRDALLRTHGLLLLLGVLAITFGVLSFRADAESAARGGGLLSGLGIYPLGVGVGMSALALCSVVLALTVVPRRP